VTARVLITDRAWPDCRVERAILAGLGAEVVEAPQSDEKTLTELARDADAIGTCWAQVTRAVIDAAPRLRVVARFGIGLDNICVPAATERRIPVTYVPDYCVTEVSDHALALLLACARKVGYFHSQTKQGIYALQSGARMQRIAAKTLGLIGLGRIARALVPKARAFGLRVAAHTASGNDHGTGCEMLPLDELLAQSDFVSLHAPLTDQTRRMIGPRELSLMKPTAYLINTSRGGLIDHEALRLALEQGRLAGAALDVFDPEPPDLSDALFRDERVIVTPHAAFLSEESLEDLRRRAALQIADALRGVRPEHVANPEVYAEPA